MKTTKVKEKKQKFYNGIKIEDIKIDCETFNITDFIEKYGTGSASDILEILQLNGCIKK